MPDIPKTEDEALENFAGFADSHLKRGMEALSEPAFKPGDLAGLIERLEKSVAGGHELDCHISYALFYPNTPEWHLDLSIRDGWTIPPYSTSLDAAVALVEQKLPGAEWTVSNNSHHHERRYAEVVYQRTTGRSGFVGMAAATPAIAICIALLRALQAQEETR